jgi:hypothetical protein
VAGITGHDIKGLKRIGAVVAAAGDAEILGDATHDLNAFGRLAGLPPLLR